MQDEEITSLAYTVREINRVYTHMEAFNIAFMSDLEVRDRVGSCLGCFDTVERAYVYHTKATGSLGEHHL